MKIVLCYNIFYDDIVEINIIVYEEENWLSLVWG